MTSIPNQQQVNLDNIIPNSNNEAAQAKRKLIVIGIIAVFIIIIVAVIASTINWDDVNGSNNSSDYDGVTEIGSVNYVCGSRYDCDRWWNSVQGEGFLLTESYSCFYDLNDTNCAYLCSTETLDYYDMEYAYYVPDEEACYCQSWSMAYDYDSSYYCFNTTEYVIKYELDPSAGYIYDGRPYYLDLDTTITHNNNLIADIKQIDCNQYEYYGNDEWIQFITHSSTNYSDVNKYNEWIQKGLAEHASIATFSKFNLELMSIGSPLWLIQLATNAITDEIRHTQIAFDIANTMNHNDELCITPNKFPSHKINIDGDWNKIALDTAIGGCIGETISALTMEMAFNNIIDEYIYSIAMDEIRHSALAWTTIKWMIEKGVDIDVYDKEWWESELKKRRSKTIREQEIIHETIPLILSELWKDMTNEEFYKTVTNILLNHVKHNVQCRM